MRSGQRDPAAAGAAEHQHQRHPRIGTEAEARPLRGSVVPRSELAALFPEEKISEEWSSYVCLSVTDTGCGMDKETMQHIFEPFFTTKKTGEGTGLGLALADQIIRTHRGRIRAESTIGRGTTFYVYLPVLEQQQEREQLQWGVDSKLRHPAATTTTRSSTCWTKTSAHWA